MIQNSMIKQGTTGNGTDRFSRGNCGPERFFSELNGFRSGRERFGTERIMFWNGTERIPDPISRPQSKEVSSSRKPLTPQFCAECTDRRIHSSHGDYFRDHFCLYISGQLSANFRTISGQLSGNFRAISRQLSGNFRATFLQLSVNFRAAFGQTSGKFRATFGQL